VAGESPSYGEVLRNPLFWLTAVITSTVYPSLYFNVNWLPTYFNQQRGVAPGSPEMKWILTLVFLGLDLGYLTFGFASLHLSRRTVFTIATVLVTAAAGVPFVEDRTVLIGLLAISNFGLGMWMSTYLTLTQEVSKRSVSTAMGLLGGIGSLAGAFLMWIVGMVTERTHSFAGPFVAIAVAILAACVAGWRADAGTTKLARRH
jgi:sugar phosphate permease